MQGTGEERHPRRRHRHDSDHERQRLGGGGDAASAQVGVDGRIGFRVGKDMNLHISTFDVTRRLAPAPIKKD
jgi:hypothetical protein